MPRFRPILVRLFLYAIASALICSVLVSELPESISLIDNTSNDFILRGPVVLKNLQTLNSAKNALETRSSIVQLNLTLPCFISLQEDSPSAARCLFIFLSVLRT